MRYSSRVESTTVLGPGERSVIWVHGCCFSCPGCIGERYRTGTALKTSCAEMAEWFLRQNTGGLTVSGGEPMLQCAALAELISRIRSQRDCGLIVYTGFVYETLLEHARKDPDINEFLSYIDLLIDGPYIQALDENQFARGSSNQRLLPLTERYRDDIDGYYAESRRRVKIRLSRAGTFLVGVPGREEAAVWQKVKQRGKAYDK